MLSTGFRPGKITDRLGETWEIALNTYKPFACGIVIHPAIDGCVQLRNEHRLQAEDIDSITLKTHPLVLELTGKKAPQVGLEGKFSVYHSCAVALIYGAAGEAQYSDACVRDPNVVAVRDRVQATADGTVHEDQVRIAIRMKDGRILEKFVEHAIGSLDRPMSDADLEAKFRGLVEGILSPDETGRLLKLCWDVSTLKDAAEVARASVPAAQLRRQA